MPVTVRVSGAYKNVLPKVKVLGTWKDVVNIFTRVAGTWKPLWSYTWLTGSWGACDKTCGGGTQSRSVTCQRSDGTAMTDAFCLSAVGAKPADSQSCNTQVCNNNCKFSAVAPYYGWYVNPSYDYGACWWDQDLFFLPNASATSITYNGCYYYRGQFVTTDGEGFNYYICRCCPSC